MTASTDRLASFGVARDLVEMGREQEAVALLDAEAPDRLDAWCDECGEGPDRPCSEMGTCTACLGSPRPLKCWRCAGDGKHLVDIVVPHDSRALGARRAR